MSDEKVISVPLNVSISVIGLLGWMGGLEVVIAGETDAGRHEMAKVLKQLRDEMAELLPPEVRNRLR